ncbi:Uncharacterized membrane-anchored protein YjiN, DUF445 family [Acinetobacter marinus]|uniref:Uncharacterized membrane-anchored protein YjiN, DUF445 family n=1 Tax=Acinetobacter marinus TaxID=281375 RepID=A0A1G6PM39_9GAMM|nr:DUF445 domain-containing protein [Acinetobacter marinus]SDC80576.1 Uncharacterized membrane-anchored protein YjiN, DUF445 family [Acinetobacter marinus]
MTDNSAHTVIEAEVPSLNRSKRLASIALIIAVCSWLALMILAKVFPEYLWLFHILMLSAEAGVVGGLADWYAITVLFRNPFGKMPLPKLLRDHTEIIPRNKARIAESMGKFVQENFLSPTVVQNSLAKFDLSLASAQWLQQQQNSQKIVDVVQFGVPKIFEFVEQQQISNFIQDNSIQWLKSTKFNNLLSEMLRAVLDNDFHQEVLQRGLDMAHQWVKENPKRTYQLTEKLFSELGVGTLARGATWIGIDVQQRTINAFISKVEQILADPEHPWRMQIEQQARKVMEQLADPDSEISLKLNESKNKLLDSPQLVNFIGSSVAILCNAIKQDLEQENSGIASNLHAVIMQLGQNIERNQAVREVFNQRFSQIAVQLSSDYSDKVIRFISERIHEWDSHEMIDKIETEVGGDLHMIRVNGVVVGAFIGLCLGIFRAVVEHFI